MFSETSSPSNFGRTPPGAILLAFPRHNASGEKATRAGMEDGVDLDGDNEQRNGRAGQDEGGREGTDEK